MNIYDIAQKAKVSIATVSRVLNNSPNVREQTRERVLTVMREEGYVPNAFARGLGLNSMRMVGVMCTEISDLFFAGAVGALEKLLRENGMDTVLCCTGNDLQRKKDALAALVNRKVDAIILIGSRFREEKDNSHICTAAESVPVLIVNGLISAPGVYCVLCDEKAAMRRTVSALYRDGCRRIHYLFDMDTYSGQEKLAGYRLGCRENGLQEYCSKIEKNVEAAQARVCGLLTQSPAPDAIVCAEDLLAAGALNALHGAGMQMPVVGFDNSVIASCTTPTLTSVDNLCRTMCEMAVRILLDLGSGKPAPQKTVLSAQLVQRGSFQTNEW